MGWTSANSQRVNTLFYSRKDGLPICLDCIFLKNNIRPKLDECIASISFGISAYRNSCDKYQSRWVGQQRYEVTSKNEAGEIMFYENEIKCPYTKCVAGMGVAGNRNCFLGGDYTNSECDKFQDEDEFLKEWEEREKKL